MYLSIMSIEVLEWYLIRTIAAQSGLSTKCALSKASHNTLTWLLNLRPRSSPQPPPPKPAGNTCINRRLLILKTRQDIKLHVHQPETVNSEENNIKLDVRQP